MKLKALVAAVLMISLLSGCSLSALVGAQPALPASNEKPSLANLFFQQASATDEEILTREDAKQIALHHAKATDADTKNLQISFEYDDGIPEYDISFFYLNYEFEYEIHGISGRIISYEREKFPD